MLTRAVRRRRNLRYAQHAAEHIQLPWLCPALWSSHTTYTRSQHRPVAPRAKLERRTSGASLSTNVSRQASATPGIGIFGTKDAYTSFDLPHQSAPPAPTAPSWQLPPLSPDLSNILMIDHSTRTPPEILDTGRKHNFMRGNAIEIEATMDACLQIHRWDRSLDILSQLQAIYQGNQVQLQRLYNKVLEAMVFDHIWNGSSENVKRINGWVESHMQRAGVMPNAQTFALKIKAAMATLQGRKRDRTVLRYWEMAKEYNVDWEVASLRGILSDSDLGKLSEISPLEMGKTSLGDIREEGDDQDIAVRADMIAQPGLPEIRATSQKGLGMVSLKRSLSLFDNASEMAEWTHAQRADEVTREEFARRRQLRLEEDSLNSAVQRWKVEHAEMSKLGITSNLSKGKIGALLWSWHAKLLKSIHAELDKVTASELRPRNTEEDNLRAEYGPFLRLLSPQDLAALTITSVIQIPVKSNVRSEIRLARLVIDVGRTIEAEVEQKSKKQREQVKKAARQLRKQSTSKMPEAGSSTDVLSGEMEDLPSPPRHIHWSVAQCAKVGSILCELLFDIAKVKHVSQDPEDGRPTALQQPAFERRITYVAGRKLGVVGLHDDVIQLVTTEPVADLLAKELPMVCKPKPWTAYDTGGYYHTDNPVLRVKFSDQAQKEYTKAAAERGDLDQLFKGLDVLGQTGWRINLNVFKVMAEAWNTGDGIANLPPIDKVFAETPPLGPDATPKARYDYHRQVQARKNEESGIHSNRCFQNFQMEIAKAYAQETFYLPHNVDFRGRAYPIPPYLNQMGADNARGLLLFAEGRPLGEHGFKWLKVHLANVCGYDKASLSDRAKYADEHMLDIRDSVQNPLSGNRWWLQAEDPWQCLATCFELVRAIDSGKPETYVSHLPVHQDGTCNGLQHYAALGGDVAGARQVNLEPGDKPADVYTGVAELVKAQIKQDADAGDELAKLLDGRITRKIVKQTVMTNVYGVTFTGAMAQVKKQLDDLLPDLKEQNIARKASAYIAKKIFKGLGTLFEGAHNIQYWFGDCANRITNSISLHQLQRADGAAEGKPTQSAGRRVKKQQSFDVRKDIDGTDFRSTVIWTTPLRLPVVQPYRVSRAQSIKTHMAHIQLTEPNVTDSIDKRKQLQAFPPNFIHSLDATHMLLSALQARAQGLTFSAVHDSFWTHAADVDALNTLLRDAFVRMHSEDIVGRLAAEFEKRYKGHIYLAKIDPKSPLARKILEYRAKIDRRQFEVGPTMTKKSKINSAERRRKYYELMKEYRRQKMLESDDPVQQKKARQMVTAASIFESMDGEKYIQAKDSLGETALAHVPDSQIDPAEQIVEQALVHDERDETHDVDMEATLDPLMQASPHTSVPGANQKRRKSGKQDPIWVWLPLKFKPVPKKGDWNVQRLKDSIYFFS